MSRGLYSVAEVAAMIERVDGFGHEQVRTDAATGFTETSAGAVIRRLKEVRS